MPGLKNQFGVWLSKAVYRRQSVFNNIFRKKNQLAHHPTEEIQNFKFERLDIKATTTIGTNRIQIDLVIGCNLVSRLKFFQRSIEKIHI